MSNKKILFHINSLGKGGAERVVSLLAEYFAKEGYQVKIITLWRAEEEYELSPGIIRINMEELQGKRRRGRICRAVGRLWDFRRCIRREKPDLVISFCNKANFRCAYAMLGMKTPLLVSVRNDPRVDYKPYPLATRQMVRKAKGCVFQTSEAKSFFASDLQRKSRLIMNPVNPKYLSLDNRWTDSPQKRHIITVGRLSEQKNQLLLLKAFYQIMIKFPEVHVKLYGTESNAGYQRKLIEYCRENHMEERVHFMGESDSLEKELQTAALFVLPSDYEGLPNALMEAMAMGLPVIATDCPCGGSAELIRDGWSGILTPVGDEKELSKAMERILTDRLLAARMGKNAREIGRKASPEQICRQWETYAEEIMAGEVSHA